jgi:hypothetical protein
MGDPSTKLEYNVLQEKWIDLDGTGQIYLRITYGQHRPITDINFYRIKYYKGQPHRMVSLFSIIKAAPNISK